MVDEKGGTEPSRLEVLLQAILLLQLQPLVDEEKRGSIEGVLYRAGFTNKEIVEMTGTPKSTVSQRLKAEGLRE